MSNFSENSASAAIARKLVATYDLKPIHLVDAAPLLFRIEVWWLVPNGPFEATVLRTDQFRMLPTTTSGFTSVRAYADHELLVIDDAFLAREFRAPSEAELVKHVLLELAAYFGIVADIGLT